MSQMPNSPMPPMPPYDIFNRPLQPNLGGMGQMPQPTQGNPMAASGHPLAGMLLGGGGVPMPPQGDVRAQVNPRVPAQLGPSAPPTMQFNNLLNSLQAQTNPHQQMPQQPPPFEMPQPMPFIQSQPMQMQMPNFSQMGGRTAPPDPAMNMTMPSMKGLFGVR